MKTQNSLTISAQLGEILRVKTLTDSTYYCGKKGKGREDTVEILEKNKQAFAPTHGPRAGDLEMQRKKEIRKKRKKKTKEEAKASIISSFR